MHLRLVALLSMVLLLVLMLPVPDMAAADTVVETVVDEVDGLPDADGVRADSSAVTTEPIETPIAFSMLAFAAPSGATISYRTSTDGETWTDWRADQESRGDGPDPASPEALRAAPDHRRSGEPMWVGEAAWLQAKVEGAPLGEVLADLIDSMGLSRSVLERAGAAVRSAWNGRGLPTARAAAGGAPSATTSWSTSTAPSTRGAQAASTAP